MAGKIQSLASGFLDLLGAKTNGRNPVTFGDDVLPTIRMNEFYELSARDWVGGSGTCSNAGGGSGGIIITVPENEWWRLLAASGRIQPALVGTLVRASLRITGPSSDSGRLPVEIGNTGNFTSTAAAIGPRAGITALPAPIWLRPGEQIVWQCELYDSATPGTIDVNCAITRIGPATRFLSA